MGLLCTVLSCSNYTKSSFWYPGCQVDIQKKYSELSSSNDFDKDYAVMVDGADDINEKKRKSLEKAYRNEKNSY